MLRFSLIGLTISREIGERRKSASPQQSNQPAASFLTCSIQTSFSGKRCSRFAQVPHCGFFMKHQRNFVLALLSVLFFDEVCRRLMTTPGVGPVVALTYRATVDVPARFRKSKAVAAVFGPPVINRARSIGAVEYRAAEMR